MILTRIPPIKSAADIPLLGKGKDANPEDRLWREAVAAFNGVVWPGQGQQRYAQYARLEAIGGDGSANWGEMALLAGYAQEPETYMPRARQLARWMLGETDPEPSGSLKYFQASEPLSCTYDGYTVGSWAGILGLALKRGDAETAGLFRRLITAYAALVSLCSMPRASKLVRHAPGVSDEIDNPSHTLARAPAGARSTLNHLNADPSSLMLSDFIDWPGTHKQPNNDPWDFWYLQLTAPRPADGWIAPEDAADMRACINGDLDAEDRVAAKLKGLRWNGPIEIWRWADRVLVMTPRILNGNTTGLMLAVVERDGPLRAWWPWPKAKSSGLSSGRAWIEENQARCESQFATLPPYDLPPGAPRRRYVLGPDGMQIERDGTATGTGPGTTTGTTTTGDTTTGGPGPAPGDRGARLAEAAGLIASLKVAHPKEQLKASIVNRLGGDPGAQDLAQIIADADPQSLGIGPGQSQFATLQKALDILKGLL